MNFKKIFLLMILIIGECLLFKPSAKAQCNGLDIIATYSGNCLPVLVKFVATPAGPKGSVYYWDLGDGNGQITGGDTFYHQYSTLGDYGVSLEVVHTDGSKCKIVKPIGFLHFDGAKSLGFYADQYLVCSVPGVIILHDTTTNIQSRDWYINGNLYSDHSKDIVDTIKTAGYVNVTLAVTNNVGCIQVVQKNKLINIPGNIPVGFCSILHENATHDKITLTNKIGFDTSGFNVSSINWDFTGGTPSSYSGYSPPSVLYSDLSNPNSVTLRIKTRIGCDVSLVKTGLIDKYYSIDNATLCEKDSTYINFVAKYASFRAIGFQSGFNSNLNIGLFQNLGSNTRYKIHFTGFGTADIYAGIYYETNPACIDSLIIPSLFNVLPPKADFTSTNTNQCTIPTKVNLHALYGAINSGKNSYTWHVYDSLGTEISGSPIGPLSGTDTTIAISNYGPYTVKLVTNNTNGCSDSIVKAHFIRVIKPNVDFSFSPDTLCTGATLTTKNLSTVLDDPLNPLFYDWRFYHKDSSKYNLVFSSRQPNVVFNNPGIYTVILTMRNGNSCLFGKTSPTQIVVNGITADITASANDGCAPLTKTLSAKVLVSIPGGPLTYNWSVTPAANATILSPTSSTTDIVFSKKGCYSVKLIITNSLGCQTIINKNNFVCIGTTASFTIPTKGCRNAPIIPSNTSTNGANKFKWTVTPSTGVVIDNDTLNTPHINITQPGCYKVLLTTSKSNFQACPDTVSHKICIFTPPTISKFYSLDSDGHCAPKFDRFYAQSNYGSEYFYNFGDSTTLLTKDTFTVHAYFKNNNAGYTVKVAAIDSNACVSDTVTLKNYLKIAGPEPNVITNSKPPCSGGTVTFLNLSKYVSDYFFLYGDNSSVDSNQIRSHYYKFTDYTRDSNLYRPTIFAYDETGCVATSSFLVKLYRPPVINVSVADTEGCNPLTPKFFDSTKYSKTFLWTFGDGATDTAYTPVHVYKTANPVGNPYQATLTATTDKGCVVSSRVMTITVHPTPKVNMTILAPKIICYQDSVHFKGITSIPVSKIIWNFGDSTNRSDTSSLMNPVYHYKFPGKHKVTFKAITSFGCMDSTVDSTSITTLDSLAPAAPKILYVTVTNTNQVEIVYEKKSTPKFKSNTVYSYPSGIIIYNTTKIADTVVLDNTPTVNVNKQSYGYSIRTNDICGFISDYTRPHYTIFLAVTKAGNRNLKLVWNKYTGWDSVTRYEIYKLNSKNKYILYATVSGIDSSFTDTSLCPGINTFYVSAIYRNGVYKSNSNIGFNTPDYVFPSIPLVLRKATVVNNQQISINWDPSVQPNFKSVSIDRNANDEGWQSAYSSTTGLSFTDNNVDVNKSFYRYRVRVEDQCGNMGPASNTGTSILLKGYVANDVRILNWNSYTTWAKGVTAYYIQLQQKNGTFKDISVNGPVDSLFNDALAHDDLGTPTCYRVYAVENTDTPDKRDTSISNIACPNLTARLYIPNAFSPNGDSINEVFRPQGLSILTDNDNSDLQYDFRIFNRWGQAVFETHDFTKGWDGKFQGNFVPIDVYVYLIEAHGRDGQRFYIRGQVTVYK